MAKTGKQRQASIPRVDQDTAAIWDSVQALKAAIQKGERAKSKQKKLKKTLEEVFDALGTDEIALPDGRVVERRLDGRDMPAQKARRDEWYRYSERD